MIVVLIWSIEGTDCTIYEPKFSEATPLHLDCLVPDSVCRKGNNIIEKALKED